MHFVVLIRNIYFFLCFVFHVSLAVVTGAAIHANVPLAGSTPTFLLGILGSLALIMLLGFDLHRTQTGTGYFCFVYKIWFELLWMTVVMAMHLVDFLVFYNRNSQHPCVLPTSEAAHSHLKPCLALQLSWAFQISVVATIFLYLAFLGIVSILHHAETSQVFSGSVRGFPWGRRNTATRSKISNPHAPIYFPTSSLPTFDEAFANVHKNLEEGKGNQVRTHGGAWI